MYAMIRRAARVSRVLGLITILVLTACRTVPPPPKAGTRQKEFFAAVRGQDLKALEGMTDYNVNAPDPGKNTALHLAAKEGSLELTRWLLAKDAKPNAGDAKWRTPLHLAIEYHAPLKLIEALLEGGADVQAKDKEGATPLHYAAARGRTKGIVSLLIDRGAKVDAKANDGMEPLHFAVLYNSTPEIVKELLDHGANPNAKDKAGTAPLYYALGDNPSGINPEIIRLLVHHGGDVYLRAKDGLTPMARGSEPDRFETHADYLAINELFMRAEAESPAAPASSSRHTWDSP